MRKLADNALRALSLVVTDRRWAAPLSAMALGFGLFIGVAIGPGASGTLATGGEPILAVVPSGGGGDEGVEESSDEVAEAGGGELPETFSEPVEEEAFEPEYAPEPLATEPAPEEAEEEEPSAPAPEEEPETEARQLKGTVVHANPAAGSYTLAIAGGELVSVHAPKLPTPGSKLSVEAEPLANNTFAQLESKRSGTATGASVRGVVTYVDSDPAAPAYTLSGRGSSILVRVPAAPQPQLPALGAYATVEVGIEKPAASALPPPASEAAPVEPPPTCVPDPALKPAPAPTRVVVQRSLETEAEPATYVDIAGIVTAVCPATGQVLLSADDLRQSGADLLLSVPAKIATDRLELGDSVVATATVGEDASLALAGLASDEHRKGAEDSASAQGDLKR